MIVPPGVVSQSGTPLDPSERKDLIPSHVATMEEVNELERANIEEANAWAFSRRRDVLSEPFLRSLHRHMFNKVWRWAGKYRKTPRNFGVPAHTIDMEMRKLLEDARCWIEYGSYPADEIAVRFHHNLVCVHPFPNGNGRWSRMAGDLMAVRLGARRFSWGRGDMRVSGEVRKTYVAALKSADGHDFTALMDFARS